MIRIRTLDPQDREQIRTIVAATGVFTGDEVDVAMELVDIVLNKPGQTDYTVRTAVDESDRVLGYYCIGQRPMTEGTFDLYWIAVKPSDHNRGIGRELLRHAENEVSARQGRLLIAETSSQPKYLNTREFYLHNQYAEVARIRDFYRPGDDLVVYGKYVSHPGGV